MLPLQVKALFVLLNQQNGRQTWPEVSPTKVVLQLFFSEIWQHSWQHSWQFSQPNSVDMLAVNKLATQKQAILTLFVWAFL